MSNGPMCCGFPAKLNVISPRLQFYVCVECKKEVFDIPAPPKEDEAYDWPPAWMKGDLSEIMAKAGKAMAAKQDKDIIKILDGASARVYQDHEYGLTPFSYE